MSRYAWSMEWVRKDADPQKCGEEYEKLEHQLGGVVTPADLLAWAEAHPRSHIYRLFEWDDEEAANKHRLQQASSIILDIREYKVRGGKVKPVRRNYKLKSRGGYVNRTVIETEVAAAEEMLFSAYKALGSWLDRFAVVEDEASAQFRAVRKAHLEIEKLVGG
jgi:hypothetical protein